MKYKCDFCHKEVDPRHLQKVETRLLSGLVLVKQYHIYCYRRIIKVGGIGDEKV